MTAAVGMVLAGVLLVSGSGPTWVPLAPGLELGRFDPRTVTPAPDGALTVLRVDPGSWQLQVLTPAEVGPDDRGLDGRGLDLARWCRDSGAVAVINAGMYQEDGTTHVGFCQTGGVVRSAGVNGYRSALLCDPRRAGDPLFRLADLDAADLDSLRASYGTVVQNLRLIKRPGENRWSPTGKRWSEAALAEDAQGRALLIHCAVPMSMYEFNELLLALPLEVVAAQHLEGNHPAGLWVHLPSDDEGGEAHVVPLARGGTVPNVLAVLPRPAQGGSE